MIRFFGSKLIINHENVESVRGMHIQSSSVNVTNCLEQFDGRKNPTVRYHATRLFS